MGTAEGIVRLLVLRMLLRLAEQVRSAEAAEATGLVWARGVVLRLAGRSLLRLLLTLLLGSLILVLLGLLLLSLRAESARVVLLTSIEATSLVLVLGRGLLLLLVL